MARMPTPEQLTKLADDVNAALAALEADGYHDEVETIRAFIRTEGTFYVEQLRVSRDITAQLGKQISEYGRRYDVPVKRVTDRADGA